MKKTLIALTVTSLFSTCALASTGNVAVELGEIENVVNELAADGYTVDVVEVSNGKMKSVIRDAEGVAIGTVESQNGSHYISNDNNLIDINTNTGKITRVQRTDGGDTTVDTYQVVDSWKPNNDVANHTDGTEMETATQVEDAIERVKASDPKKITDIRLKDGQGNEVAVINKGNIDSYIQEFNKLDDKDKAQVLRDIKAAATNGQIKEHTVETPNNDIIEIDTEVNARIEEAGKAIYKDAAIAYNDLDSRVNSNSNRISGLESQMKKMGDKMLDLEDRMDGVVATSHAVTNARPMVQDAGEFAMGVGIGAAGSKQALALGGAYQFNANWSSSVTVNYETAGKRSNSQVSAGAGVQYRFK